MQDKARTFSFATKKTDYQALVDDPWFLGWTDTVYVIGGYLEYMGSVRAMSFSQPDVSFCNYEDGYIWDIDVEEGDEEVGDIESMLIDTIVTNDTEGIFGKIVN